MPAFLLCADYGLHRADFTNFSDQTLMERIATDLSAETQEQFQDSSGDFIDVCEWEGIECDADARVVAIEWEEIDWVHGEICIDALPPLLRELNVSKNLFSIDDWLVGTLSTETLPHDLELCNLSNNKFHGEVNFSSFPEKLREVDLSMNQFVGEADLTRLPPHLKALNIGYNVFRRTIQLNALPRNLRDFDIESNKFEGSVEFKGLPGILQSRGSAAFFSFLQHAVGKISFSYNHIYWEWVWKFAVTPLRDGTAVCPVTRNVIIKHGL